MEQIKVIYGKDWSHLEELPEGLKKEHNKYFKAYYGFPKVSHSPFNLGVYYDSKGEKIRTSQYVGFMPLLERNTNKSKKYIVIRPRFKYSAIKMLDYILCSDDVYKNPEIIKYEEFEVQEILNIKDKIDNEILFGVVKDSKEFEIESEKEGIKDNYINLAEIMSTFEIWDFVSKAKIVCQRMLKNQIQLTSENLTGKIKGKINLQKQLRKNISKGRYDKNYCEYNRLTVDNAENRILKYTLYLCQKHISQSGNMNLLAEDIAYCNRILKNVKLEKCTLVNFKGIKNNGVFKYYKASMESAKRIIRRISISFDGARGGLKIEQKVKPFFIDMNILFELYCRALVSEAIKNEKSYELVEHGLKYFIFEKHEKVEGFTKYLIPDIVLKEDENNLAVIDAKYSNLEDSRYNREKTHQIMAYMTLLNCNYGGFIAPSENLESNIKKKTMGINGKYGFYIDINCMSKEDEKVEEIRKFIESVKK